MRNRHTAYDKMSTQLEVRKNPTGADVVLNKRAPSPVRAQSTENRATLELNESPTWADEDIQNLTRY